MIRKGKIGRQVWYGWQLWSVVEILSPNKFDDFLVLKRETDTVHSDGTPAIEMILIDAHNDEFYPNSKRVAETMEKFLATQDAQNKVREIVSRELCEEWLNTCMK